MTEKKTSVFTKGQVHRMWLDTAEKLKECKSVKEARDCITALASQYRPQAKGRGVAINIADLQKIVDEESTKRAEVSAKDLACFVSANWNLKPENTTRLIDAQRVKNLVLKGKLKFPAGTEFVVNPRKTSQVQAEVVVTN